MSKRTATELQSTSTSDLQTSRKNPRGSVKQESAVQEDEIGEYEDGWEDEFESDEDVVDGEPDVREDGMY